MISPDSLQAYRSARHRSALISRNELGRIVVSGTERASYLQGLLTNDILSLKPGEGCYSAYLTPQGRMVSDMWLYELGEVLLITLPREAKDTVLARLDQFIFSEDVQLGDVSDAFEQVAVVGPAAAAVLQGVLGLGADGLPEREHANRRLEAEGQQVIVLRVTSTGEPGYDLLAEGSTMAALRTRLAAAGVAEADRDVAEALRIEAAVPRFHADMDEETIPLEAGIEARAISLTKGCYVGQEVIIRVLHRGHGRVARRLVGLSFEGVALPAPGESLSSGGKEIGRVTSRTWSPARGQVIGLGYVLRDYVAPGTALTTPSGIEGLVEATPFAR